MQAVSWDFAFNDSNAPQMAPIEAHIGPSVDDSIPEDAGEEIPVWCRSVQGPPMKLCGRWRPPPLANGLFCTHYPFAIHHLCGVPSCPHVSWVPGFETIHNMNCFLGIPEGEAWCEPCSTLRAS